MLAARLTMSGILKKWRMGIFSWSAGSVSKSCPVLTGVNVVRANRAVPFGIFNLTCSAG